MPIRKCKGPADPTQKPDAFHVACSASNAGSGLSAPVSSQMKSRYGFETFVFLVLVSPIAVAEVVVHSLSLVFGTMAPKRRASRRKASAKKGGKRKAARRSAKRSAKKGGKKRRSRRRSSKKGGDDA